MKKMQWYTDGYQLLCLDEGQFGMARLSDFTPSSGTGMSICTYEYLFSELTKEKADRIVQSRYTGFSRLTTLGAYPVFYSTGGMIVKGKITCTFPQAYMVGNEQVESSEDWRDIREKGRIIRVDELPFGTILQREVCHIVKFLYGKLSVEWYSSEFLGCTEEAVRHHVSQMREIQRAGTDKSDSELIGEYFILIGDREPKSLALLALAFFDGDRKLALSALKAAFGGSEPELAWLKYGRILEEM
jgi:hypothetical protein